MHKVINGWTKEKMIEHIKTNFKEKSVISTHTECHNDYGGLQQTYCAYRGDNGSKCGVGLFIPDEMYSSRMEQRDSSRLFKDHPKLLNVMPLDAVGMAKLQSNHDEATNSEAALKRMLEFVENNVEN